MKNLIVNADDFGYCEAVNYGIIKAFKEGIVTSTTLMANMPGVKHAYGLYKENPELSVGIHLTLTCYKPLLKTHKTLVNEEGYFTRNLNEYDLDEVYEELVAQIEYAKEIGFDIDHIDSHHHVHTDPILKPVIDKILAKYNLPVRGGFFYDQPYARQSVLIDTFYGKNPVTGKDVPLVPELLINIMKEFEDGKTYDIMCHPSYMETFIYESSSYNLYRMKELDVLISDEVKEAVKTLDINLTTYKTL